MGIWGWTHNLKGSHSGYWSLETMADTDMKRVYPGWWSDGWESVDGVNFCAWKIIQGGMDPLDTEHYTTSASASAIHCTSNRSLRHLSGSQMSQNYARDTPQKMMIKWLFLSFLVFLLFFTALFFSFLSSSKYIEWLWHIVSKVDGFSFTKVENVEFFYIFV